MKIKALITTLVLGSSSLALANPSWSGGVNVQATYGQQYGEPVAVRDHREPVRAPIVRDHRGWDRDRGQRFGRGWNDIRPIVVPVAEPQPMVDNCANVKIGAKGSAYIGTVGVPVGNGWLALAQSTKIGGPGEEIDVGASIGSFRQLQLVAEQGDTSIGDVVIQFADNTYQRVSLNTRLDRHNGAITIQLAGRGRRSIRRIIVEGSSNPFARYSIFAA